MIRTLDPCNQAPRTLVWLNVTEFHWHFLVLYSPYKLLPLSYIWTFYWLAHVQSGQRPSTSGAPSTIIRTLDPCNQAPTTLVWLYVTNSIFFNFRFLIWVNSSNLYLGLLLTYPCPIQACFRFCFALCPRVKILNQTRALALAFHIF